jgi:CO/xanthine dehydrogenase Mo-binding subunit
VKKPGEFKVVNHPIPRTDGIAKVTGRAIFTSDMELEGMVWAKVLRSPFAHARIVSIDVSAAQRHPGILDVITGADLSELNSVYGHAVKDKPILAIGKVRFIGEPVAVVVAGNELEAEEALELIQVEYDELPAVMDVDAALTPDAPLLHDQTYSVGAFRGFHEARKASGNVCEYVKVKWGDADKALASAAHVVEDEFHFPMAYAYAMEAYVAIADYTKKGLTVYSSAQHPFMVRHDLAGIFNLPLNAVRVVVPFIGGGYGSKSYTKIEPIPAVCSWRVRRPVKLQLSIDESFLTVRSDDARVRIQTGCDADGRFVARKATIHLNTGAYAENSPLVCAKAANRIFGPYVIPNVDVDCYAVYTNTVPASSYRGFGSTQVTFPAESQNEELADKLGYDALEFRLRNLAQRGETIFPGLRPIDADVPGDLRRIRNTLDEWGPVAPGHGRALGCSASDAGSHPVTSAMIHVYADDSVSILSGSTEMGQGSYTVLPQIAAEEMGVPFSKVRLVGADTAITPFERSTGASRTTTLMGRAVLEACREAISQLKTMGAEVIGVSEPELVEESGGLRHGNARLSWGEIISKYFHQKDTSIIGRAYLRQTGDLKLLPPFWEVGVVGVEISVDEETGKINLERLIVVGDVGLAINPAGAEGQDLGAATMGVGLGLFEELLYDGQQLTNGSMLEYRVPRFSDMASDIHLTLTENQDGTGPYGAKGGGEGAVNPMPACLANALYRATGARVRHLPLTPERVWRALRERDSQKQMLQGELQIETKIGG